MRVLVHYLGWVIGLAGPETQTTDAERECLARYASGRRRLVEIGVWHGLTTSRLRSVMAPDGVLSAVGPFSPGRLGFSMHKRIAHYEVDKIRNGALRWLETHGGEAAVGHELVDFLFIDGDHSEQGTLQDWLAWKGLVQPGGIVAIHDSRSTPTRAIDDSGSVKVTNEVILRDDRFERERSLTALLCCRAEFARELLRFHGARRHRASLACTAARARALSRRRLHGHSIRRRAQPDLRSHDDGARRAYRESRLAERVADSGATLRVIEIPAAGCGFRSESHARALAARGRLRSDSVAGGAARLAERQHHRPASADSRCYLHGYLAARVLSLPARASSDRAGHVVAGQRAHSYAGDHQRTPGNSLPRDGTVPSRGRFRVVRAERDRLYYGVDVDLFRPADADERARLRRRLNLPPDKFLIVLSSRISHEKDPETVLRAVALARGRGLDAVLLNLGGGYREFLALPARLGIEDASSWLLARPAVHPMKDLADYFRAADALAMASLAEGAAYFDARSAGLRDARCGHRGGRDGGAAPRVTHR